MMKSKGDYKIYCKWSSFRFLIVVLGVAFGQTSLTL